MMLMAYDGSTDARAVIERAAHHAVVQHADRVVLVVPAPAVADHRRGGAFHPVVPA